jgi:hypothetical protein
MGPIDPDAHSQSAPPCYKTQQAGTFIRLTRMIRHAFQLTPIHARPVQSVPGHLPVPQRPKGCTGLGSAAENACLLAYGLSGLLVLIAQHARAGGAPANPAGYGAVERIAVSGADPAPASPKRFEQTLSALTGTGTLMALLALPLMSWIVPPVVRRRYRITLGAAAGADGVEHRDHGPYPAPDL